jgi:GNAT superfamily N-acetyltransferase
MSTDEQRRSAADRAADAFAATYELLASALPSAWARSEPGALAAVSGVALPSLNGVTVLANGVQLDRIAALLDAVAATGLPHSLRLRPGGEVFGDLAVARGMTRAEDVPLMVCSDQVTSPAESPAELSISLLAPEEADRHVIVAAGAFGARTETFRRLITPEVLRLRGARCYLGKVDGEPVATGFALTIGDGVGIFNVGVLAEHRGRGYGTAVTAAAITDASRHDARWAWLQSTREGYVMYERMGFETLETWQLWIADTVRSSDALVTR